MLRCTSTSLLLGVAVGETAVISLLSIVGVNLTFKLKISSQRPSQ